MTCFEFVVGCDRYRCTVEQETDDLGDARGTIGPVGEPYVTSLERLREFVDGRETWVRAAGHALEQDLSDALWLAYEQQLAEGRDDADRRIDEQEHAARWRCREALEAV